MEKTDKKPIFIGTSVSNDYATLTPEVITLEGEVRLKMTLANGEDLYLPLETLTILGQNAHRMQSQLRQNLEEARFLEYYPLNRHDKEKFEINSRRFGNVRGTAFVSKVIYLKNADVAEDGTPYLSWAPDESGIHGWKLSLVGINDTPIGWAAWDDPSGVDDLIKMLDDKDSCIAIAGIVAAGPTSEMSARVAAKALRSGRKLPGINIAKIRKVLHDAGLDNQGSTDYQNCQAKILAIKSGDKRVPISVAIAPPTKFKNQPELKEKELEGLTWQQRRQAEIDLMQPLVDDWGKKIEKAFNDAGWRSLDLPKPKYYYGYSNTDSGVKWFTLINHDLWADISAAATTAAKDFYFSRSTKI